MRQHVHKWSDSGVASDLHVLGTFSHPLHRRYEFVADLGLVRTHEDHQSEDFLLELRHRFRPHVLEIDEHVVLLHG
jgi:hypothetical protein